MPKLQTLKPRLQTAGSRVATIQPDSWRTSDATSSQRGYGYRWQKARAAHLSANPLCAYCLRSMGIADAEFEKAALAVFSKGLPLPYANVVDHKIPHRGDKTLFWDRSNWQSLCAMHHSRDKQREEAARVRQFSR